MAEFGHLSFIVEKFVGRSFRVNKTRVFFTHTAESK